MNIDHFNEFYNGLEAVPSLPLFDQHYKIKREALSILAKSLESEDIEYFEFGVFRGKTFRLAQELFSDNSNFFGFDSFEGLPEKWICHIPWRKDLPKEPFEPNSTQSHDNFNLDGVVPDSGKGVILKGLFQDSLPDFFSKYTSSRRKIFIIDCDLYSSTMVVLSHIHRHLKPGDLLFFDEYGDLLNEYRAFEVYKNTYYQQGTFKCILKDSCQKLVFVFEKI